jgi:hypothetical protein
MTTYSNHRTAIENSLTAKITRMVLIVLVVFIWGAIWNLVDPSFFPGIVGFAHSLFASAPVVHHQLIKVAS